MSIEKICRLLGYSKQAYYKKTSHNEQEKIDELLIVSLVREKRKIWKRGSGRNLHASLKEEFKKHKIKIGRDKFYEVLRKYNLLNKPRRHRTRTTFSYHHFHKYPNLIREVIPDKPNQVTVSDITYIWLRTTERFSYLFLITDMYSRKILGYCYSEDLKAKSAIKALRMAVGNMSELEGCIHHSDRGIQYCCHEYIRYLRTNNMLISMTENGDPLENPIAERVNRTIKEEFTNQRQLSFADFSEGKREIFKYINFYNKERPHRSIEMLTPSVAYKMKGELKRKWKNYYSKEKFNQQLTVG